MASDHILTLTLFFPLIGIVVLLFVDQAKASLIKLIGLTTAVLTFIISLELYFLFDSSVAGFQLQQHFVWIESLNIGYSVGVDGLSLLMILLTTFLTPLALLGTWNSIQQRIKEYTIMILLLEVGMTGVFAAVDLFLFYVFWEAMLIPMYFIIGIWGGQERVYAAVKFFLFTLFGSLLMLVAILVLGTVAAASPDGQFTTSLVQLYAIAPKLPASLQLWLFLAFALSFSSRGDSLARCRDRDHFYPRAGGISSC